MLRYLENPLQGYELSVSADDALKVDQAFAGLIKSGDSIAALGIARQLLARDDQLLPAIVLEQQVSFLAGDYRSIVDRLSPELTEDSTYGAALLLLARSQDLLGAELDAFDLYERLPESATAKARANALRPRVVELLVERLERLLAEGSAEPARVIVERLQLTAPESIVALQAARDFAAITLDVSAELEARRSLSAKRTESPADLRRLAELEVEIGDPTQGVDILQQLVDRSPDDFVLREALDSAKFSWRLNMLPPEVVEVAKSDAITRADFATLLYWVIPGARSGNAQSAQIATDVPLDHPQRREVLRVLNLRLMSMADAALRSFEPDRRITIIRSLDVLLRVPALQGLPLACGRKYEDRLRHRADTTCATAARCEIVADIEACSIDGPVSGPVAREMVRRTLNLLGGSRP